MEEVIYEERLKLGLVLKLIIIFTLGMLIGITAWFFYIVDVVGPWILLIWLISAISTAIIFIALIPRKYQIFDTKLKIVCGLVTINIPFVDIIGLEIRPPHHIYGSFKAIRLGTGTGQKCIMIKRKHGMNILIQPMNTEKFMEALRVAMYRGKRTLDSIKI